LSSRKTGRHLAFAGILGILLDQAIHFRYLGLRDSCEPIRVLNRQSFS
jgi:hypothetical protein